MKNELRNMRKEVDELKSAMEYKGRENLVGWFEWWTHLSPLKYWTVPSRQNSVSHSWKHITVPKIPWVTLNHSRRWCYCRWPQTKWCVGHSQQRWREQPEYGTARYPQEPSQTFNNSKRVLFIISLGGKGTKSQMAIFSTFSKPKENH